MIMLKYRILLIILLINSISCLNITRDTSLDDWDNATWVLTSSFIIITMQSGFGLLESGMVSNKNQIHIMIKNMADILFGGFTFWVFGYAFIFGNNSNGFISSTDFFTDKDNNYGWLFSNFFFQFTFSTTATTIVSGCLAERTNFKAYMLFSMVNTFIYALPAHWVWNKNGWLKTMGVVDFAGCGPVHLVGGLTGLVGTLKLGPRKVIEKPNSYMNSIFGLFMLWWGWLGFNCGSTLGITGEKCLYASKSAVTTVLSTVGGGIMSFIYCYFRYNNKYPIEVLINGILGSLVSITACCIYVKTSESIFIGIIGAQISIQSNIYIKYLGIDDPVGSIGVHFSAAVWGILSCGLFTQNINSLNVNNGLFYGGGFLLLGIQLVEILAISCWTIVMSYIFFTIIDYIIGLRLTDEEEEMGADIMYHLIDEDEDEDDDEDDNIIQEYNENDIEDVLSSPIIEHIEIDRNDELSPSMEIIEETKQSSKLSKINLPNMVECT